MERDRTDVPTQAYIKYLIYTKPGCPYCEKAKALLKEKQHSVLVLGVDISREELLAKFPDAKSLPIVMYGGQTIGGYAELLDHLFPPMES